jgi:D-lactate dehydrogenase
MKIIVFSTKPYDRRFLEQAADGQDFTFVEPALDSTTAALAAGHEAVCVFVNDEVTADVLESIAEMGVKLILLRCAGFNNVDVTAADRLGIAIGRVPAYSPHAVAEHTLGLILSLNRKIHRAYNRVREGNMSLDGLLGFDLYGKTVGVVGTGEIGSVVCHILHGLGCKVLAVDPYPNGALDALGVDYVGLDDLLAASDIITLHCPLTPQTRHMIDEAAFRKMRDGTMLINTSRGALIDTPATIEALKDGKLGALGIDVYEEEGHLFFENLSGQVIHDDVFARLLTLPNVLVTGHQAFFTREALEAISRTTVANANAYQHHGAPLHAVTPDMIR